jgi:hypothetical protein
MATYTKYQILDEHPNVVLMLTDTVLADQNIMSKSHIDKFMGDLILPLAKQFPKWEFRGCRLRATNTGGVDEKFHPHRWMVHCGDEELGEIGRDFYGSKLCYTVSNHRIQDKRERGYADKTTKLDKAKKLILKNFRPKDLKELMHAAKRTVRSSVGTSLYCAEGEWNTQYHRLCGFLSDHIMADLDAYTEIAIKHGFGRDEKLKSTYEEYHIKRSIGQCEKEKKGAVVLIHGNTYAVESDDGQFYTYENATLPDLLKRRVGMLKLIENGQTLVNVGYRENENHYYVSLEEDNGAS